MGVSIYIYSFLSKLVSLDIAQGIFIVFIHKNMNLVTGSVHVVVVQGKCVRLGLG